MASQKIFFHHRGHRDHREIFFYYKQLPLWSPCALWLIFSFYEFIKFSVSDEILLEIFQTGLPEWPVAFAP